MHRTPSDAQSGRSDDRLHAFFAAVPRRYDIVNRFITLGLDGSWRRLAALECLRGNPAKVLDLCCGTGDLLAQLARRTRAGSTLAGVDYSPPMLKVAGRKLLRAKPRAGVSLVEADVARLPFENASFDAIGIAFAFRNLTWRNSRRDLFLAEILRVLAPGGRFVIVETSQPPVATLRALCHLYCRAVVPRVGALVSGQRSAYRYLGKSAADFSTADEVCTLLRHAGFASVTYRHLLWGVAALHVALK